MIGRAWSVQIAYGPEHWGMWRSGTAYEYAMMPPRYPMPALITEFEYWPESQAAYGRGWLYGFDYYKPGRWREFLAIEADQ